LEAALEQPDQSKGEHMTRDDITRMAREAGFSDKQSEVYFDRMLQRFAALGAAAEREACAKLCVAMDLIDTPTVVEIAAVRKCAAAIRARTL
jgi:hypothetical protein